MGGEKCQKSCFGFGCRFSFDSTYLDVGFSFDSTYLNVNFSFDSTYLDVGFSFDSTSVARFTR